MNSVEEGFKKIIENNFVNGEIKDIAKLYQDLSEKYDELYPGVVSSVALHNLIELLKSIANNEEGAVFKSTLFWMQNTSKLLVRKC
jgi:predicted nuclease with TOPRIM domain